MIRYYKKEDIDEIAKIITEDWKIAYKGIIDEEYLEKLYYKEKAERIRKKYQEQKSIVYVDKEIKGYCRLKESEEEGKKIGEIEGLYVKYNQRGKEIGRLLVKEAMKILKERGYKEVIIWCLKENIKARGFYEKIGGKLYKERYIEIGQKVYKEVSYIYKLK